MSKSILVFISHSSEDKESLIEPIVSDLEKCYIHIWLDKKNIIPGDNLRQSIFKDGLDKADIVLIFFTQKSLKSSWVDKEIKHVLREESKKGNNFDLNKIISIFDSKETYDEISERYPELTDDLLHLMPTDYDKIQLGQLISAIWSKYLSLQGGDIETQKQLLSKDKEIFQKDKTIQQLTSEIEKLKTTETQTGSEFDEFETFLSSRKLDDFIKSEQLILTSGFLDASETKGAAEAMAFGLIEYAPENVRYIRLTKKGIDFFKWLILNKS